MYSSKGLCFFLRLLFLVLLIYAEIELKSIHMRLWCASHLIHLFVISLFYILHFMLVVSCLFIILNANAMKFKYLREKNRTLEEMSQLEAVNILRQTWNKSPWSIRLFVSNPISNTPLTYISLKFNKLLRFYCFDRARVQRVHSFMYDIIYCSKAIVP